MTVYNHCEYGREERLNINIIIKLEGAIYLMQNTGREKRALFIAAVNVLLY